MPTEFIDDYEIETTAESLEGGVLWAAYVAIFAPLANPMHRDNIYPKQRVAADKNLTSAEQAEAEAQSAALAILAQLKAQHGE